MIGPECPKCGAGWNCRSVALAGHGMGVIACAICGHREYTKHGRVETIRQPKPTVGINAEIKALIIGDHPVDDTGGTEPLRQKAKKREDGLCSACGKVPTPGGKAALCLGCKRKRARACAAQYALRMKLRRELAAAGV